MDSKEIVAVILLSLISVVAIISVEQMNPGKDNSTIITIILGFTGPTITSLIAAMKSSNNAAKIEEVHAKVKEQAAELHDNTVVTTAISEELKANTAATAEIGNAMTSALQQSTASIIEDATANR